MIEHIVCQVIHVRTSCWPHNALRCSFCVRCWVPEERETSEIINIIIITVMIMKMITGVKQNEVQETGQIV
jgi:hypothetical protein